MNAWFATNEKRPLPISLPVSASPHRGASAIMYPVNPVDKKLFEAVVVLKLNIFEPLLPVEERANLDLFRVLH